MIRILEHQDYSEKALNIYENLGPVFMGNSPNIPDSKTEILVVRLRILYWKKVLDQFPNLRVLISPTTGVTHIDIDLQNQGY